MESFLFEFSIAEVAADGQIVIALFGPSIKSPACLAILTCKHESAETLEAALHKAIGKSLEKSAAKKSLEPKG